MDGAIILGSTAARIARANVHLVPDPTVPTSETGTRHRTAERVARSLQVPVVSASARRWASSTSTPAGCKHQLQDIGRLLDRANQALQTLERYKARLDDALANLTALEVEDVVTLRDVAAVVQRGEMVHRIADEIETMIIELGVDARLLRLQLDELFGELENELELVLADYPTIADSFAGTPHDGDTSASPKGLRLLARVQHLSPGAGPRGHHPLRRAGQAAAGHRGGPCAAVPASTRRSPSASRRRSTASPDASILDR